MKMLEGKNINGYVADRNMRKRDPGVCDGESARQKDRVHPGNETGKTVLWAGRL
jgi:hypothetical protein